MSRLERVIIRRSHKMAWQPYIHMRLDKGGALHVYDLAIEIPDRGMYRSGIVRSWGRADRRSTGEQTIRLDDTEYETVQEALHALNEQGGMPVIESAKVKVKEDPCAT